CRRQKCGKKVYLIKGDSTRRQKLINETHPDNTKRSDRRAKARGDVPVYLLQTDQLKDRINNALSRPTPGANYIHFPDWLGEWFFDELTYEERGADGKWGKPGKGNNEAFDLFCYIHAIAILRGYENIHWGDEDDVPSWAKRPQHNPNTVYREIAPSLETQSAVGVSPKEKPKAVDKPKKQEAWLKTEAKGGWL
ncbi:terminase gpA endonuclease subunit, partial [Chelonobacter oris]|uniref:terminase gpA endonuclease subunit n=1 Tax=Chelonobacter oris TaxID=505317 RepID=UPI00244C202D